MNKKLYVGNLNYSVTENQLQDLFAKAGAVAQVDLILDRYSGRSKGFAFVQMANEEGAKKAIRMFNGKEFEGRKMVVNEARPRRTVSRPRF